VRAIAIAAALVLASAARAAEPQPAPAAGSPAASAPTHAWELDAFVGYGQLAFPGLDSNTAWSNGGAAFALSVAYRGPHFTHPFLDISYVPIVSSGRPVYVTGSPTPTWSDSSSYALGFVLGPGWDVDWFRIRAGIGLYFVNVKSEVAGVSSSASQGTLGFLVSASALVWRPEPFALGIEARLAPFQSPTSGIYQASWEVGLTGRWDFVRSR
jgi:opacity protein-like surface antigen